MQSGHTYQNQKQLVELYYRGSLNVFSFRLTWCKNDWLVVHWTEWIKKFATLCVSELFWWLTGRISSCYLSACLSLTPSLFVFCSRRLVLKVLPASSLDNLAETYALPGLPDDAMDDSTAEKENQVRRCLWYDVTARPGVIAVRPHLVLCDLKSAVEWPIWRINFALMQNVMSVLNWAL